MVILMQSIFTCSNMSTGSVNAGGASCSLHFGRMPVARKRPGDLAVRDRCRCCSNTKMSCIVMTSPSMPVISEIAVTLRVPSDMRVTWTIKLMAEAICCRIARSGIFRLAIATIVSSRYSASRGLLA